MATSFVYEDIPRYVPQFRIVPFVDHFEKGQYYKRLALCLAATGQGYQAACSIVVHWSLNDSRVVLLNTVSGQTLLYATEGLGEYLSTTPVYNAVNNCLAGVFTAGPNYLQIKNHISQDRHPREFKCYHSQRGVHTLVFNGQNIVRIQYSHTIGPSMNFLPFQKISENERNLLIILAMKIFGTISGKFMRMPLIPLGQLGLINPAESAVRPLTNETVRYILATLEMVRFTLSSYLTSDRKCVNIIKENCRIVFTLEICKIGTQDTDDEDAQIDVNDNYGVTFFKATGLKMNQRLVVHDANHQLIGSAEQYYGDLYAHGPRRNTYILDDKYQRIMEVRYSPITETLDVARYNHGCDCEIFSVSDPNVQIAEMFANFNRLHMKLTPIHTVPANWKLLALLFGAKIVNRVFTRKFKKEICTPHLGYI